MSKVLVTGANRGIGLEFVRQYARNGNHVIATCRDPENASELTEFAQSNEIEVLALDVANQSSQSALVEKLAGSPIDLLINNAGIYKSDSCENLNREEWIESFVVNSIAPIELTIKLLNNLEKGNEKKVAYVTSLMGSLSDNTSGGSYSYRSSKSALNMGVRSLTIDLEAKGIATVLLHPGWVITDMTGPNAQITTEESVNGMRRVIDALTDVKSGSFIRYNGEPIAW